jgi:hypothetical protein
MIAMLEALGWPDEANRVDGRHEPKFGRGLFGCSVIRWRSEMIPTLLVELAIGLLPIFSIDRVCQMDTEAAQEDRSAYQTCVRDEEAAKTKVAAEWSRYPMKSRTICASEQTDEYVGSYVELMTCLEIQDWKTDLGDMAGPRDNSSEVIGGSIRPPTPISGYSARQTLVGAPEGLSAR